MPNEITGKDIRAEMAIALAALAKKQGTRLQQQLDDTKSAETFATAGRFNAAIGALALPDNVLAKVPGMKINQNGTPYLPAELVVGELEQRFAAEQRESNERRARWELLPDADKAKYANPDLQAEKFGQVVEWNYIGKANKKVYSVLRVPGSAEVELRSYVDDFNSDFMPIKKNLNQERFPALEDAVASAYRSMGFPVERIRANPSPRVGGLDQADRAGMSSALKAADLLRDTSMDNRPSGPER
jgi:hypothetical protein